MNAPRSAPRYTPRIDTGKPHPARVNRPPGHPPFPGTVRRPDHSQNDDRTAVTMLAAWSSVRAGTVPPSNRDLALI